MINFYNTACCNDGVVLFPGFDFNTDDDKALLEEFLTPELQKILGDTPVMSMAISGAVACVTQFNDDTVIIYNTHVLKMLKAMVEDVIEEPLKSQLQDEINIEELMFETTYHEMVHYRQFTSGRMAYGAEKKTVIFDNQEYTYVDATQGMTRDDANKYMSDPWEREAFTLTFQAMIDRGYRESLEQCFKKAYDELYKIAS